MLTPNHKLSPIGVSLEADALRAVQYQHRGSGWALCDAVTVPREEASAPLAAEDVTLLAEVLKRRRFKGDRVAAALPNAELIRGLVEVKPDDHEALLNAALEIERGNGLEPGTYELAAWEPDMPAESRQAAVVVNGCRHDDAERWLLWFNRAGLRLEALDSRSSAAARCVDTDRASAGDHLTAVLDIGRTESELILVRRGVVVYQRSLIDAGLGAAHAFLADQGLDHHLAAFVLHQGDDATHRHRATRDTAIARLARAVAQEADPALDYAARLYAPQVIERLAVIGEGASIDGLEEAVAQELSLATASTRRPDAGGETQDRAYTVATGLALAERDGGINLLPQTELDRRAGQRQSRGGVLVAAGYSGLLLLGAVGYLSLSAPRQTMAAGDRMAIETARVEKLSVAVADAQRDLREGTRQLEASRVLSERPNWSTLLDLVARASGGDVVLDGVRVETTGPTIDAAARVQLSGTTRDPWQVSAFVLSLEQLGLFERVEIADSQRAARGANAMTRFTVRAEIGNGVQEAAP